MSARSASNPKSRRGACAKKAAPVETPKPLTAGPLCVIAAFASLAIVLGMVQVSASFAARDFEIETRRMQELASVERDEVKRLEARLSRLGRDDSLRAVAQEELKMVEPPSETIGQIAIDPVRRQALSHAADEKLRELEAERVDLARLAKEAE
ncbi:MAG: hypothetical protein RLY93_11400 [Sumerlaeia bacterium]